jgi:branched-chain amino acid transport system permease protein
MELFVQAIVSGLSTGSIYALVALGLVLLYRTTTVLNFAHGDIGALATFLAFVMLSRLELPYFLVLILTLGAAALIGGVIYWFLIKPAKNQSPLGLLILTLGLAFALGGFDALVFGTDNKLMAPIISDRALRLGGISLSQLSLFTGGVAIALMLGLWAFLHLSKLGLGMRAVAERVEVAKAIGIPVRTTLVATWAASAILAAAAALLFAPTTLLQPSLMLGPLSKGFVAAVIGGMNSLPGAVVGGLLLGVMELLVGTYVSLEFKASFGFLIVIVVLVVKPNGLLGRPEVRRV